MRIATDIPGLTLESPAPNLDAPIAATWFDSPDGRRTLLMMGIPVKAIGERSIARERRVFDQFVTDEAAGVQIPWTIHYRGVPIGVTWIDLSDTTALSGPAVHIMIGDRAYRGRGFGASVIRTVILYAETHLRATFLHTRHLTANPAANVLFASLGFSNDGDAYHDDDGVAWQNRRLAL